MKKIELTEHSNCPWCNQKIEVILPILVTEEASQYPMANEKPILKQEGIPRDKQKCQVAGCTNITGRTPPLCDKHWLEKQGS